MNIMSEFRSIRTGLKNLWKYRKIVWNDRDFDYHFMLEMLHFKLCNMKEFWESGNTSYIGSEQELETLKALCADLKLLIDDDFMDPYMDVLDEKYGKLGMSPLIDGRQTLKRSKETTENEAEARLDTQIAFARAEQDKNKVKERFFNTFKEQYCYLWD